MALKTDGEAGGWVVGVAVIIGFILFAKCWTPPPPPPSGDDDAVKILREASKNRPALTPR